jgi:hypothetical protein
MVVVQEDRRMSVVTAALEDYLESIEAVK